MQNNDVGPLSLRDKPMGFGHRSLRRWGVALYPKRFAGHAKRSESLGQGEGVFK